MLNSVRRALSNIPGWSTNRHIVVFESDDWGSIRIRSKKDYNEMREAGLDVDETYFTRNDCLESNDDLERFYDLLSKHKDATGRAPVFTPMCILANPDFEKIKDNGFKEFYYEHMPETCNRYPNHDKVVELWHKGIEERLFVPALHGREHLNYVRWMNNVRNSEGMRIAFEHQSVGIMGYRGSVMEEYLGAFKPTTPNDLPLLHDVVIDAGRLFEAICGYKPTHFIAPNAEPMFGLDASFAEIGVKYITNAKIRHHDLGDGRVKKEFVWPGKFYKELDIINISRNGHFEQSSPEQSDWVDYCLADIRDAFRFHKPCVISSHRVNYIGSINEENATNGLRTLDYLLFQIEKNWPDVEYMTSTELGDVIRGSKKLYNYENLL